MHEAAGIEVLIQTRETIQDLKNLREEKTSALMADSIVLEKLHPYFSVLISQWDAKSSIFEGLAAALKLKSLHPS